MNAKERGEWLKAVGACLAGSETGLMSAACAALDAAGSGRWEVSVRAGELRSVGVRFFGAGSYAEWRSTCVRAFSLSDSPFLSGPRDGFPWLTAAWDLRTGAWTSLRLTGELKGVRLTSSEALGWEFKAGEPAPVRRLLRPVSFRKGLFKEPVLDAALDDFSRLCPLSSLSIEEPGWSLRLERGLSWPLFARCDISAAFTPTSSQLALFLLDRRVTELSFDGEGLWAHCTG